MKTLILDIETAPLVLDDAMLGAVTRRCRTPEERTEVLDALALSPLTGQVVCVGMLNPDSGGSRLLTRNGKEEAQLLAEAWKSVAPYQRVVTFNGRCFDFPFLMTRSAILNVPLSRRDMMGRRYAVHPHCDLLDQLSYYGAMRRHSLEAYCLAFGIASPKGETTGADVGKLFVAGEHQKIADYCLGDVQATAALYRLWIERLAGAVGRR